MALVCLDSFTAPTGLVSFLCSSCYAIYSASILDRDTIGCFLLFQLIGPLVFRKI